MNEQVMPKVAGKRFRCSCGCNVFTKYETGRYRCNSCRSCYESEEAAPSASDNSSGPKLPTFDDFKKWWFDKSYAHSAEDVYHFFTGNFGS